MNRRITRLATALAAALPAPAVAQTASVGPHTGADASRKYEIVDLTELAASLGVVQCEARGIDANGRIVGFELLPGYLARAIVWTPDGDVLIPPSLSGDNTTYAVASQAGFGYVGTSSEVTVQQVHQLTIITEDEKATLWVGGVPRNLNTLVTGFGGAPFDLRFATDANGLGQIVGRGRPFAGPPYPWIGFLFDGGQVTDLGLLDHPLAMNSVGQVVGYNDDNQDSAYLWDNGTLVHLGGHPDIFLTNRAWDINDQGLVVGEAKLNAPGPEEPVVWDGSALIRLAPEFARPQGIATAVNEHGTVVGFYNDLDDLTTDFFGFLWQAGVRTDLLSLLDDDRSFSQLYPFDVNDRGEIVGGAFRNGMPGHGFLMRPIR